ncbi:class I SAM-dependent methyltransferase [Chitinophaga nivalis]|uniref:Class I SAM-dependent methyltransferase n=1 Tax=Chitinophaga nivalis TaxID=2991709 RepID=A0ABT3ISE4_9BACT|nr:class I SAM-dependent methyltransferase [Chitinophaga nivalis]MCW3463441.1 class I SAM-dependent methyltransferase [Chitinophaga nivalis]MCW3486869.1 class I SAM-dependent methyltransferase [Chitinophaga nivalis]
MKQLRYFLYIWWHWGFSLACFILKHEIRGEKQYGIQTMGVDNLTGEVPADDLAHASVYEPVNYYTATWLLNHLEPADLRTAFLDVGCGKGRVLAMAAAYGFKEIAGFDFSARLCRDAMAIGTVLRTQYPDLSLTITCMNARYYDIPETVGVIFLFNPFDAEVTTAFIGKVAESLERQPRPLKILYANPQCKQQWLDAGFKETASFRKQYYLQGCVLELK